MMQMVVTWKSLSDQLYDPQFPLARAGEWAAVKFMEDYIVVLKPGSGSAK